MEGKRRGVWLTIFAIALALMALSDFSKPFKMSPNVGFVFFGTKLTGIGNTVIAPLVGIMLAALAYGIWTLRQFALPIAYLYAAYVILNMLLFVIKYHGTAVTQEHSWAYLIPYPFVAIGVSSGAAWLLYRRMDELQ